MRGLEGEKITPSRYITHLVQEATGAGAFHREWIKNEGSALRPISAGASQFLFPLSNRNNAEGDQNRSFEKTGALFVADFVVDMAIFYALVPSGKYLEAAAVKLGYNAAANVIPDILGTVIRKIKLYREFSGLHPDLQKFFYEKSRTNSRLDKIKGEK